MDRIWRLHWVPYCHDNGKSPLTYDVVNFANFLDNTQVNSEIYAASKGKTAQHGTYKERCAAISGCFELRFPDKPRLSLHPHVCAMSAANRRQAPNTPKYHVLPDMTGPLSMLSTACNTFVQATGSYIGYFMQMPLPQLRDESMFLLRLDIGNRSKDLSVINRVWSGPYAGLQGNQSTGEITHIRYDFPKNWHSRVRMSEWISLGDFKSAATQFKPEHHAFCSRSAIQAYYNRTVTLPIKPCQDKDHPQENKTRLFISLKKQDKGLRHIEVRSNTIAKRIKAVLQRGGVDVSKFTAHVLRHFSLNSQIALGKDLDDVLSRACVSNKVFSMYYKLPLAVSQVSDDLRALHHCDDDVSSLEMIEESREHITATSTSRSRRSALRITGGATGSRARKRRRTSAAAASRI